MSRLGALLAALVILLPPHVEGSAARMPYRVSLAREARLRYGVLKDQLRSLHTSEAVRKRWRRVAPEALTGQACLFLSDRDPLDVVLRRTEALLRHLSSLRNGPNLKEQAEALARLGEKASHTDVRAESARLELFLQVLALRRSIAFANPLLRFPAILFVKRHSLPPAMTLGNHMCDQYFGFHAVRGGGLFCLHTPFGQESFVENLLKGVRCRTGRLKGKELLPGAFLSACLSFDAEQVAFCYTEGGGERYRWTTQNCYHLFAVRADGSDLRQLTDGPFNDISPAFLPGGGMVFVSERRGGFGRCHPRPVRLFTLHRMKSDGTGIVRLSHHEANEWHPSVNRAGRIVYTRWDYTDRGNIQAHHGWITTPDGADPRPLHGNYRRSKATGPTMEMHLRQIPRTRYYVATAAAHHGQAYGSLVLIDPDMPDDNAMGPVRRITPEVPFPESETTARAGQVYATAWPLSTFFYLCVYDPRGSAQRGVKNNYGIYLLDAFGNKDLIYRDPAISCLSPVPLVARRTPPVLPSARFQADSAGTQFGLVGVLNVYHSRIPFPRGVTIRFLRVIEVLVKTTPLVNQPRIGYGNEKGARRVLGTVPVEEDGSAYLRLPAGIPVYFQALDENGLAVQSMRSDTYVQPGGVLLCRGCHEPAHHAPLFSGSLPRAFRRPPSELEAESPGSDPFSFAALVQPVLDRHCVSCHTPGGRAFDLTRGPWRRHPHRWYSSYVNLRPYAFFYGATGGIYDPWCPPETFPGRFGARASKLFQVLKKDHYGVRLSRNELHRITLWLDCNCDFSGSYEAAGKEPEAPGADSPGGPKR